MPSNALYLTAALYKFVDLPDFADLQAPLQACCEANEVKGTLLLAHEGINGTIAGPESGIRAVLAFLHADPRLATLQHKESWSPKPPFTRMKVKLKKEIVTMQVPGISPTKMAGTYVKPEDWNALISDPDVDALYTKPPHHEGAQRIEFVTAGDDLSGVEIGDIGAAGVGTGGASTKIAAAKYATAEGIPVILTATPLIAEALDGAEVGTWFEPAER